MREKIKETVPFDRDFSVKFWLCNAATTANLNANQNQIKTTKDFII